MPGRWQWVKIAKENWSKGHFALRIGKFFCFSHFADSIQCKFKLHCTWWGSISFKSSSNPLHLLLCASTWPVQFIFTCSLLRAEPLALPPEKRASSPCDLWHFISTWRGTWLICMCLFRRGEGGGVKFPYQMYYLSLDERKGPKLPGKFGPLFSSNCDNCFPFA